MDNIVPSVFGRDLIEQVHADSTDSDGSRQVPVIVEKCIDAVEALGELHPGPFHPNRNSQFTSNGL